MKFSPGPAPAWFCALISLLSLESAVLTSGLWICDVCFAADDKARPVRRVQMCNMFEHVKPRQPLVLNLLVVPAAASCGPTGFSGSSC